MSQADYLIGVEEYELAFVEDVLDDAPVDAQTVYKETIDMSERAIAAEAAFRATSGGGGAPSGPAGGVLAGTYPNPGFAADMATQAELDALSTVYQPLDSDLTAVAALTTTAFGRSVLEAANAAALRTLADSPSNAEAVLDSLFDAKGDMILGTAADTVARLAAGANGTVPTYQSGQTTGVLPQFPPGYELAYAQITTSGTSTQTVQASATTVLTAPSVTFDGSTEVIIEVYSERLSSTVVTQAILDLWEDTTDLGIIARFANPAAATGGSTILGRRKMTPTAGAKVYTIRMWVTAAATATLAAGSGSGATSMPAYIRITKA